MHSQTKSAAQRADVIHQQQTEQARIASKDSERAVAKIRMLIEQEQQLRHPSGPAHDALVRTLVFFHIAFRHAVGQRERLLEPQANTLPRDRIDGTGSIADERDPALCDSGDPARCRNTSPFFREMTRISKPRGQIGEMSQSIIHASLLVAAEQNDTYFQGTHWRDVDLQIRTPVHFHTIGPRRDLVMPAEAVADASFDHAQAPTSQRQVTCSPPITAPSTESASIVVPQCNSTPASCAASTSV